MADATADVRRSFRREKNATTRSYVVTTGATIYKGTAVTLATGTGTVGPGGDDANTVFVGIATETVTSAAAGTEIEAMTGMEMLMDGVAGAFALANFGAAAVLADDTLVNDAAGETNDVAIGYIVERISDTQGWVKILFAGVTD